MSWEGSDTTYVCIRCWSEMTERDINERGGSVKCISCGYRILKKTRPPVVKRIEAR